jgi:histidyl-tRNA synthetase
MSAEISGARPIMSKSIIKPQTLKGFRDYLPGPMIAREHLIETARSVYRSFGFSPIDTPALEYSEILLGKGGDETDKQLFRFTDQGERDVAMRFDLTVPLARFAAQHLQEIGTPFKRYHIATVWRAEKPQKGRFREFIQCDFDTIGTESHIADAETLLVIHDLMERIGFSKFTIRVNHRLVLNGLLESLGIAGQTGGILRSLDKLGKIGREAVIAEMTEKVGASAAQAESVLKMTALTGDPLAVLDQVEPMLVGNEHGAAGVQKLRDLFGWATSAGVPQERLALDLSIARGLDYYTGTIYETFLNDLPGIGSVCSGGRYDNLAGLFTSQKLPGVGASLGLDRLLAAMEELGMVATASTPAPVIVILFDGSRTGDYFRVARRMRAAGIETEVFCDARPVGKQLGYASKKGFRVAVIAGESEFAQGAWQIKDLGAGQQTTVPDAELIDEIKRLLQTRRPQPA